MSYEITTEKLLSSAFFYANEQDQCMSGNNSIGNWSEIFYLQSATFNRPMLCKGAFDEDLCTM